MWRLVRFLMLLLLLLPLLLGTGACGYRLAGARVDSGSGRTIGVPTFRNRTTTYRIEQRISEALRRELIRRTRYTVSPEPSGDVIVTGEVVGYSAIPVLFTEQGRASSYTVSVDVSVIIREAGTGAVLFENPRWTFREVFELAQTSGDFVPEEPAAVERLAQRFASSLVATFLNRVP